MKDLEEIIEELVELKIESNEAYLKAMKKGDSDDAGYCKGKERGLSEAIQVIQNALGEE